MNEFKTLRLERPADGVLRVVMNRPKARNAQNLQMTYDLHAAFDMAVADDSVRAIILAGEDPHFSSGHDLRDPGDKKLGEDFAPRATWGGFAAEGAEGRYSREQEIYLEATRRWRELSKPLIAQVQGRCIAGGLMLAWACDLIIASDDASFQDPVVTMGVCGVEWFVHPQELGPRKAKELLWTAERWTAEEAHRVGMVNHVVPRAELADFTVTLAARIASMPPFAVAMTKKAVNHAVDIGGQAGGMENAFGLHQLCHAHNMLRFGQVIDPAGIPASVKKSS